jgi:hypothetical protein
MTVRKIVGGERFYRGTHRVFNGSTNSLDLDRALVTAAPLTVMAWIYLDSIPPFQNQVILGIGDLTDNFVLDVSDSLGEGGLARWYATDDGTGNLATGIEFLFTSTWYLLTGVEASSTSRKIYVNGYLEKEVTTSLTPVVPAQTSIGAKNLGSADFFFGSMAWVTTWNAALEPWEIVQAAQGRHPFTIRTNKIVSCVPCVGGGEIGFG